MNTRRLRELSLAMGVISLFGCQTHDTRGHATVTDTSLVSVAPAPTNTAATSSTANSGTMPQPVAEATIRRVNRFTAWPVLPVTIQGQPLAAAIDLGSVDTYLGNATSSQIGVTDFTPTTVDVLTLGTQQEMAVPVDSFDGVFAFADAQQGLPPVTVLLGSALLSHYDLVFDGPAQRVRLYPAHHLHFATAAQRRPSWVPTGVTVADCVPMEDVASAEMSVRLSFRAQGHTVPGGFDSGSGVTYMNAAAANLLGLTPANPRVHRIPSELAPQFVIGGTDQQVWGADGVTLTLGAQTLTPKAVLIYPYLPDQKRRDEPLLNVGMETIQHRVFYISYSSGTVCLGPSA